MRNKVLAWCREQGLFCYGETVICAVSGGADSTAMLHMLCALQAELEIRVSAAHYNHRLRGEESDRDEAFVRSLCRTLGVPLTVSGGDVARRAEETGESIEEAARKMRYAFLEGLGGTVATAHTADDNLETVLLNLVRGTSLRGLCGIPPKRGKVVRPVLCLTREEIEKYLKEQSLPHVEDSTNAERDVRRNRIRLDVVPLLRQENPAAAQTVLRAGALLRQDEAYLEQAAEELRQAAERDGGWSCAVLKHAPETIRSRAVRQILQRISAPKLTSAHIRAVCALIASEDPSAEAALPGGWTAARQYELLTLGERTCAPLWKPVTLCMNGVTPIPELGLQIRCHMEQGAQKKPQNENSATTFICGCDMMEKNQTLLARPRASQDTMRVSGGHRTLKRLMIDRKIPAAQRSSLPVIVCGSYVIGVYGVGENLDNTAGESGRVCVIEIEKL